jgi:glycosyltransferase involved in cell wall biosynthesis
MNEGFPLVSIITPVYNGAEFIEELILSVKSQNYPNIEHLIIDDGSEDGKELAAILNRYPHLRWWRREKNRGQYATMNEGLLSAKGDVVCFISADDVVVPGAIFHAMDFLRKAPTIDGVFGVTGYIDADGNILDKPTFFPGAPIALVGYFAHIPHCSLYIKKSSLERYQLFFNPSLKYVGDYDWMIRIGNSPLKIRRIKQELSEVRIHPNQATQKFMDTSQRERREVMKIYHINNWLRSLAIWAFLVQSRVWTLHQVYNDKGFLMTVRLILGRLRKRLSRSPF